MKFLVALPAALVLMLAAAAPSALAADCTTDRCRQCQSKQVPNLANKDKCVACEGVADATVRQACYDCIESSVPSDPQQCILCTTREVLVTGGAVRCMDCMRKSVPADTADQKRSCLACGTIFDGANRQRCFDCVEKSVPGPADKNLCYHCAYAGDVNTCFNCLETGNQPIKNKCVTKWHFNWVVGRYGDTAITAKCGDTVEFDYPGQPGRTAGTYTPHNLYRLPGAMDCPQTDPQNIPTATRLQSTLAAPFTYSEQLALSMSAQNNGAPRVFYECSVGANYGASPPSFGHCTTPGGNMQVTVTLTGC